MVKQLQAISSQAQTLLVQVEHLPLPVATERLGLPINEPNQVAPQLAPHRVALRQPPTDHGGASC